MIWRIPSTPLLRISFLPFRRAPPTPQNKFSEAKFIMTSASKPFEMGTEVAALRKNYESTPFLEEDLVAEREPIAQFDSWFKSAKDTGTSFEEVNAMTLATVSADGRPSARIVLLKGYGADGFRFFTNYESRKGRELAANPFASLVFYWPVMNRSVRIEGRVEKLPADVSDSYFHSRPHGSQIGASVSHQSTVLSSRSDLEQRTQQLEAKYPQGTEVPRPENWGGFLLRPDAVEFWQGQSSRLHDRIKFHRENLESEWVIERLSP